MGALGAGQVGRWATGVWLEGKVTSRGKGGASLGEQGDVGKVQAPFTCHR